MTDQPTFADLEYGQKMRMTRRGEFLEKLERLVPWQRLEERHGPHYFRGERGRRPYPLPVMLRVHIVQLCYNLSDPAMKDLLYEAESVRRFVGLYAYRKDCLLAFTQWERAPYESSEGLEQLRFMEHGVKIRVVETEHRLIGVDVPADLERVLAIMG